MLKNIIHEIGLKENRVYIIGKSEGVCYNYTEVKRRMLSMKNVIDDKNPLIPGRDFDSCRASDFKKR